MGEGVRRGDRCGGSGVCGEDWVFLVGASVFVAPVEGWGDWEGSTWGEVYRFDTSLARWAADFHDKGEGGGVELSVVVSVEDHVEADVGEVVSAVIAVCDGVDGVLGVKGCVIERVADDKVV